MVQTRKQHAYERIRERLRSGELLPGDRLAEIALARELQVSRGPLREAINQLVSEGLVQQTPGLGAYVHSPDEQEIVDMYETREALECFAVEKAATRMGADQLDRLQQCCDDMRALLERYRTRENWDSSQRHALLDADAGFHALIAEASRNARVVKLLDDSRLLQRMLAYHDRLGSASTLFTRSQAWGHHVRILQALRARDPVAARRAMAEHIAAARRNALAAYEALQRGPGNPPERGASD